MNSFVKIGVATILPAIFTLAFLILENRTSFGKKKYIVKQVIIGVIFGGLAVLGTEFGITIPGATVNVRDGAVITAGLIFGAPAGIIAGLIGGIERYFAAYWGAGTYTQIACTVSTILAGFYSAFMRKYVFEDKKPSVWLSFTVGLVIEIFHMTMVFVTNMADTNKAIEVVKTATVVMVPANSISCFISACIANIRDPRNKSVKEKTSISRVIQKYLLAVVAIVFVLTSIFVVNLQVSIADNQSKNMLNESIEDVMNEVTDTSDEHLLTIARNAAKDIQNGKTLKEIYQDYDVLDMSIINKSGIIVESLNDDYLGFNLNTGDQSSEFLVLLDPSSGVNEFVQDYGPTSMDKNVHRKYAAVKYKDGFIQVGYDATTFQMDIASTVRNVTKNRHIGETGFMFIANEDGAIVSVPKNHENIMLKDCEIYKHEKNSVYTITINEEDYLCQYDIAEGYTLVALLPTKEAYRTRDIAIYANSFMEIIVFGLMFAMIYMLIKKIVISKIKDVNTSLGKITDGNLNEVVNVREYGEFESLSDDINSTVDTLKKYIAEASARIDAELSYAKNIQDSTLPHMFPNDKRISLYALMDAAKEVGGDFYDFYSTKDNYLNFMIADVSGKGIPGAMFMMRAKSELHSLTDNGLEVNDVFTNGNNRLCTGNDAGMFVTAWQGCIDLNTGHVKYANAGHNRPIIVHNDGKAEYVEGKAGFVLAGMENIKYKLQEIQMQPGEILFLYTDGVVEATDINQQLYGDDRLLEAIQKVDHNDMNSLCNQVLDDVNSFVKEAEQFDDITMVAIKYNGN